MSSALLSPHWYRVAALRPRLPAHVRVHRHDYRNVAWTVLEDPASGRQYRFNREALAVIAPMDGTRTVEQIAQYADAELGSAAPTQTQIIQLLSQLYAADLLLCDLPPDIAELFRRQRRGERDRWRAWFLNPLSLRWPLFDPDRFLERMLPWVRPLFSRAFAIAIGVPLVFALVLAVKHAPEIMAHASARALAPQSLVLMLLLYPLIKIAHELGHAFATRIWGGAVHEVGLMFLVFVPVPYVNASAASAFPEKHRRMIVAAAGIVVELVIAAFALFVWIQLEPGLLRDAAFSLMVIGSVSTLLFNGNPLMRFDAYYVFADAVGIPNLAARAGRYYAYLGKRYLLGLRDEQSPVSAAGERGWFAVYGFASFLYRIMIMLGVALFLSAKFFFLGAVLATWMIGTQLVAPLFKTARFVLASPALQGRRRRALLNLSAALILLVLLLGVIPLPLTTCAPGVVWLPEQAQVRVRAEGFIEEVLVADGATVHAGDALLRLNDPDVELQVRALEAQSRELELRYLAVVEKDRVQANGLREKWHSAEAELDRLRERAAEQIVRADSTGLLVLPDRDNLPGRFVKQGEVVGFLVEWRALSARVIVSQSDIALIRRETRAVRIVPVDRPGASVLAGKPREVGGTVDRLPSRALALNGGIDVDPLDSAGVRTRAPVFQLDVALPPDALAPRIGTRVIARFDHGYEPIAYRWIRAVRRQLLRQSAQ